MEKIVSVLVNWLVMALAIIITSYLLPGVSVSTFVVALLVALVIGILNAFIKPILLVLSLPINILTLGLFTFVINGFLIWLTSRIVPGFHVAGFWWGVLFSIILSIVLYLLHVIFGSLEDKKK
jgi:putative membrane protein